MRLPRFFRHSPLRRELAAVIACKLAFLFLFAHFVIKPQEKTVGPAELAQGVFGVTLPASQESHR